MGVENARTPRAGGFDGNDGTAGQQTRSLFQRFSKLFAGSPATTHEAGESAGSEALDLEALRQRMTPSSPYAALSDEEIAWRREHSFAEPARTPTFTTVAECASAAESVEPQWKPIVLSSLEEEALPGIPSLDELAEEGGISPTALRFPVDA